MCSGIPTRHSERFRCLLVPQSCSNLREQLHGTTTCIFVFQSVEMYMLVGWNIRFTRKRCSLKSTWLHSLTRLYCSIAYVHNNINSLYRNQIDTQSRDSVVGIATGYGLDCQGVGVRVPVESRIFSSSRPPNRLWGPPSLVSNGYWRLFPRG
jgi:hypothetical protein